MTRSHCFCLVTVFALVLSANCASPRVPPQTCVILLGERASGAERVAAEELQAFLGKTLHDVRIATGEAKGATIALGTPESSAKAAALADLSGIRHDGFVVAPAPGGGLVIASREPRGVLYGALAAIDAARLGRPFWDLRMRESPRFADRIVWTWTPSSESDRYFLAHDEMARAERFPRFRRLGLLLARMRVNGFIFWSNLDRFSRRWNREKVRRAYAKLMEYWRENFGLEFYVFQFYQIEYRSGFQGSGYPLCPFDEKVRAHWKKQADDLFAAFPHLKGYIMAGAGGWMHAPWECRCGECRKHTKRELLGEAFGMIAATLRPHGGRLIWKAVSDRPTLVRSEVENFSKWEGKLPPEVVIAHKNFYKDFRQPHPYNPLLVNIPEGPPESIPYLCEFQIMGEYRGYHHFPCVMIDRWAPIFQMLAKKGHRGVVGVISLPDHERIDHPLNMANWHGFGRLAWNPAEAPGKILREWAELTYGPRAVEDVVKMCRESYPASTKMMFFKGVMIQNHSQIPSIEYELEASLVGPWHDIPACPPGMMGRAHDVGMYPSAMEEAIREDPALLLWAKRVPITGELADEAIRENEEAIGHVEEMIRLWEGLSGRVDPALHAPLKRDLGRNLWDAKLWREDVALYFDYKAGRLTRSELDRRLKAIREIYDRRPGTEITTGGMYEAFVKEWQRVLDKSAGGDLRPIGRRLMEGKWYRPDGAEFLPGLKPE